MKGHTARVAEIKDTNLLIISGRKDLAKTLRPYIGRLGYYSG